jgi:hypothetical protein
MRRRHITGSLAPQTARACVEALAAVVQAAPDLEAARLGAAPFLDTYYASKADLSGTRLRRKQDKLLALSSRCSPTTGRLVEQLLAPGLEAGQVARIGAARRVALHRLLDRGAWQTLEGEARAAAGFFEATPHDRDDAAWVSTLQAAVKRRLAGDLWGFYEALGGALEGAAPARQAELGRIVIERLRADLLAPASATALLESLPHATLAPTSPLWPLVRSALAAESFAGLLSRALDAGLPTGQPKVLRADATSLATSLAELSLWRWDVEAWTRRDGQYVFTFGPEPKVARPVSGYAVESVSRADCLERLRQVAAAGREVVGICAGDAGETLSLLTRARPDGCAGASYHLWVSRGEVPDLQALEARDGRVCAYARLAPSPAERCWGQPEHLFVIAADGSERLAYRLARADNLEVTLAQLRLHGWAIAGMSTGADGQLALLCRRAVPTGARVRDLCDRPPRLDTWTDLGRVAAAVGSDGRADPTLAAYLTTHLRLLCTSEQLARLCGATQELAALPAPARTVLRRAVVEAVAPFYRLPWPPAEVSPQACLVAVVELESVAAASLLVALGCDAHDTAQGAETSAYHLARAMGHPALCEALDGNPDAAAEWARLGPQQRVAVRTLARRAFRKAAAAAPQLRTRLLAHGLGPDDVEHLLRYLRRRAPIWMQFGPRERNGLLRATRYVPRPEKRDEMERARFAGAYHRTGPREERPKYAFLNAQRSLVGFAAYGGAALVLRDGVRARVTLTARRDHNGARFVGTLHCLDHVLMRLDDAELLQMAAASRGDKSRRPLRVREYEEPRGGDFIEMHIHGPVALPEDARKVVMSRAEGAGAPEDWRAMSSFLAHHHLPLRWRGHVASRPEMAAADRARLAAMGLLARAWVRDPGGSCEQLFFQPRAHTPVPGLHYEPVHAPLAEGATLVAALGRAGTRVLGMHIADGQLIAMTQSHPAAAPCIAELWHTISLDETLLTLQTSGWSVSAYTRHALACNVASEYYLAAEYTPEQPVEYLHVTCTSTSRGGHTVALAVQNRLAELALAGWELCGLMPDRAADGTTMLVKRRLDWAPDCQPPVK